MSTDILDANDTPSSLSNTQNNTLPSPTKIESISLQEDKETIVSTQEEQNTTETIKTETSCPVISPSAGHERIHKIYQHRGFCYHYNLRTPDDNIEFMNCIQLLESYSNLYDVLIINTPSIIYQDTECMNAFRSLKLFANRTTPVVVMVWCPVDRLFEVGNIMSQDWKIGDPSVQLFCDWSVGYSENGNFTPYVDNDNTLVRHVKVGSGIILDATHGVQNQISYGAPNMECMLLSIFHPNQTQTPMTKIINKTTQQSLATLVPHVIHCAISSEQFKQHPKPNIDVFRPEHVYQACLRIFSHSTNALVAFGKYTSSVEPPKYTRKQKSDPVVVIEKMETEHTDTTPETVQEENGTKEKNEGAAEQNTDGKKNTSTPTTLSIRTIHHISVNTVGYYSGSKKHPDLKQLFRTYIVSQKMDEAYAKRLSSNIRLYISTRTSNHQKYIKQLKNILDSIFIPESPICMFLNKLSNTKEEKEKIAMRTMMETLNEMLGLSQFRQKRNKRKHSTENTPDDIEKQPPRKKGNFQLSDILQKFIGNEKIKSCCTVMSRIHSHIKKNNLRNEDKKTCFTIDDTLAPIFDMRPGELLPYFRMPQILKQHYIQTNTPILE
jgi:hypothetical protein